VQDADVAGGLEDHGPDLAVVATAPAAICVPLAPSSLNTDAITVVLLVDSGSVRRP
jgi:hypothetical protein